MNERQGTATRIAIVLALSFCAASAEEDEELRRRVEHVARELEALGLPVALEGVKVERRRDPMDERVPDDLPGAGAAGSRESWALFASHVLNCDPACAWVPAAYYAPLRRAIVLADTGHGGLVTEDEAIAHELAHVRQHGRNELWTREWCRLRRTTEECGIVQCLVEGEAEAVQLRFSLARFGRNLDEAVLEDANLPFEQGTDSFAAVQPEYALGRALVVPAMLREGWDGVARLHEHPPASTEQLLHPEKMGQDVPTPVVWPEVRENEGSIAWQDTVGEMYILGWLASHLGRADAWPAASGWDGDSWRVLRLPGGSRVVVWLTIWDREADAAHFAGAVRRASGCEIFTNGRVVVCSGGEDAAAARHWGERGLRAMGTPAPDPLDAASTTKAEERWFRTWRRPVVSDGWWKLPLLGLRVPVPPGWDQGLERGAYVLRYHRPTVAEDAVMFVHVVPTGGPATVDLVERRLEELKGREAVERVLVTERVTVAGRQAILAEHAFGWARTWAPMRYQWLYLPTDRGIIMLGALIPNVHRKEVWEAAKRALLDVQLGGE